MVDKELWVIGRCYKNNNKAYPIYGGRGVVVCDEWKNDRVAFMDWAVENGYQIGLQLDKDIKGDGFLYSPNTCCFVTSKENNNHKRKNVCIEYKGERKTLTQLFEISGIIPNTIKARLKRGWDIDKVLNTLPAPGWAKGRRLPQEQRDNLSKKRTGTVSGGANYNAKKVINTETGEIYGCISDAAATINKHPFWLGQRLRNKLRNKTPFVLY